MLVFSLCLFALSTGPATASKDDISVENTAQDSSTIAEPLTTTIATDSVTVTTVAMTTRPSDERKLEDDDIKTDAEKENFFKPLYVKPKKAPTPEYLLYVVEKGIRDLPLKDIEFLLDIGKDANIISLTLADKLGYLPDGDDSDPHVKVIEDNWEQIVSELESRS